MNPGAQVGKGLRVAGGVLLLFGVVLLGLWLGAHSSDRHGALFLLGGGGLLSLAGAAVWTIGYSLTMTKHQGE
jgi:hypothetical protein